ncbi:MAG: nuclear transport factor 2 family protein [Saprospiraceae bacterium]|nr:nuclear transport factor 2 family protein [Saprospiraceae bacterium]
MFLFVHLIGVIDLPQTLLSPDLGISGAIPNPISVDEGAVIQAEKSRFKAMVEKDFDALDKVIHNDLVYIHSNGSIDTKDSFIAPLKDGSRSYDDITIDDPKVRVYGEVGIINATCTYHRTTPEGRANNLTLLYTSVYAHVDDRWQHVSWQSFKVVE